MSSVLGMNVYPAYVQLIAVAGPPPESSGRLVRESRSPSAPSGPQKSSGFICFPRA
jgi:hypothetical protein